MKPIDYKTKYLCLVKSIVIKEGIAGVNYSRALAKGSTLKQYEIGVIAGKLEAFAELLDEIKKIAYSEEKTKSSDFYPCADENGMVGT